MLFLLDIILGFFSCMSESMTFSSQINNDEVIAPIIVNSYVNTHPEWIFDYEFVERVAETQLVDNIAPELCYDMSRYVDEAFISSHPYFFSQYADQEYSLYLKYYVNTIGAAFECDEYSSHINFLNSAFKKLYIYNYPLSNLDATDYYILEWAKKSLPSEAISFFKDYTLNNSNDIKLIAFNSSVDLEEFKDVMQGK